MFRLLAPILIVAVSGFGSPPAHYDQQHCVDAPAQEVAAYTASLGGGAEVLTSCDAVAASGGCDAPEAKIGCCATCSDPKKEVYMTDDFYEWYYWYADFVRPACVEPVTCEQVGCEYSDGSVDKGCRR